MLQPYSSNIDIVLEITLVATKVRVGVAIDSEFAPQLDRVRQFVHNGSPSPNSISLLEMRDCRTTPQESEITDIY